MNTAKFIFLSASLGILLCLFDSCRSKPQIKAVVEEWQGKELILPTSNLMKNAEKFHFNPLSKKLKILTLINASCGKCVEELVDWKKFMAQTDTSRVGFIFLCYSIDEFIGFDRMDSTTIKLSYPYFQDRDRKLIVENSFSKNILYHTFLLDEVNKVILVGNPIYHEQIRNLYLKEIQERLNTIDTGNGVRFINEPGRIRIQTEEKIIFKDEKGNILSKKEMKEKAGSGKYMLDHNSKTNVITLRKID